MNFANLLISASGAMDPTASTSSLVAMLIPLGLMVVFFYFFLIRPEKKRSKEMQDMLNNIQVADEVVTNGGIIGRVVSVKEDTVLLETGSDRTKIRILKQAIAKNNTVHEQLEQAAAEKKAAKKNKDKPTEIK